MLGIWSLVALVLVLEFIIFSVFNLFFGNFTHVYVLRFFFHSLLVFFLIDSLLALRIPRTVIGAVHTSESFYQPKFQLKFYTKKANNEIYFLRY